MANVNSSGLILEKIPLANSASVDIAPFAFETDKTGLAPASLVHGGRRYRKLAKKTGKRKGKKSRRVQCKTCKGWKFL